MATGKMWVLTGLIAAFLAVAGLYSNSDSHSHLEAGKMGTDPILQKLGTDPILDKMGTDPILQKLGTDPILQKMGTDPILGGVI